jgi:ribosomal protein L32E
MGSENKETGKRSKPRFLRNDWHKKIRLGRTVKKNRKWKGAKGRHNKLRLNRKGHTQRPKVGWGSSGENRDLVGGLKILRIENLKGLESVKKGMGIIIGKVGKKNKDEIILKAKEMKISVLNRYQKVKEVSK